MMPNHDPQAPAIELAHLTFAYEGSAPQLEDVNLTVQPGEVVVLTGPSGGGKSTLTRVVNGLVPSFYEGELTGTVRLFGREVDDIPSWERGLAAGNVFQDPRSQFFANEVAGEIAFGCENYGLDHELIVERVHGAASELDIAPLLEEKVRLLSYGMRLRVAIASAK
ncbi:MAG: ABC transporter ATP-binding protein, partial [Eggerthella lenta]